MPHRRLSSALLSAAVLASSPAFADCGEGSAPGRVLGRLDNDVWGGTHQDQGYTAGANLAWSSPTGDLAEDDCLPAPARLAGRALPWLVGEGRTGNVTIAVTQAIYTPMDRDRTDVILEDRPYAGITTFAFAINVRDGDRLATTQLRLGLVGPSARGEEIQGAIHGLFGRNTFAGWDNQLRDEPVIQLGHERVWRRTFASDDGGRYWEGSLHAGGVAGNLATYANFGGEIRFGRDLPDDMVSSPFRLAGDGLAPRLQPLSEGDGWRWHVFASLDNRLVAHDITLDGSTWKDSHSVDRRRYVADLTLGIVFARGPWRFAATHTRRTREFAGQAEAPVFGTFSLSRTW
ncbi:lipid A deacylase LpxR family protein [Arenimonas composti]|uniref:Lipid A deacylase LpxR family protein n=1 Tax=Arenimonas composti TR7-09 = DSM 18010 TaxID=1121013 RepID=A0A091BIU2_9GAMM|nr:lipid A deacylase LpxR family protein [Arenimonas composti]KFN51422.1 hypothetical protein P873_02845 [Arenimonas composti TR7-09 = DSM 18010]